MKRIISLIALFTVAAFIAACGGVANNTPANNTNANTAKPTAAAPTVEMFLDMQKKATEAYSKGDGAYFEGILADKAIMSMGKDRMGKAAIVSMIRTAKCELKDGVKLSEPQMSKIDNDTYAFTHRNDSTGTCTENGKSMDMKPTRASTVWVRSGDKWQAVWHGETEIMAGPASNKKDEKPAANTNAAAKPEPAKMTPSANTDALTKAHSAGWEAFKNKDAKAFDGMLASTFANVGPDGSYIASKADAIKMWTETMKCEGITKTSFTDTFAAAISPTVEILFGKGNADGTCNGQKNGDLWQTGFYVKEGDVWKLAYMLETAGM